MSSPRFHQTPALPPITRGRDKQFLGSLQAHIDHAKEQLQVAGQCDVEQQCIIYGRAFDKVIDYCTDYKGLLAAIKREYDEFIDVLKQSQRDAVHLQGKLRALASQPTTLMYHRKRATELAKKLELIQRDSQRVENQLEKLQHDQKLKTPELEETKSLQNNIKPSSLIPGMTVEDSVSMEKLTQYQQQLEQKRDNLKADMKNKYVSIQEKIELEHKLSSALQDREEAELLNNKLMVSYRQRKLVMDAILVWTQSNKCVSLYDAISQAIANEKELQDDVFAAEVFHDLDPSKVSEGQDLLEYIERFNELFLSRQYNAAAIHAANSPRGILRNMETMEKFKAAVVSDEETSPVLLYFEALISSSHVAKHPVSAELTLEATKCALACGKLDLVLHWVSQQRITYSEALGDVIYDYGERDPYHKSICLALAQLIYRKCTNSRKAALCMCLQGLVQGALEYTSHCRHFSLEDYGFLLRMCPSAELIHGLTKERNGKPAALSVGQATLSLISTHHKDYGFQLLESILNCGEGALEQAVLNDVVCTPEGWVEIADECLRNNYVQLSEKILSIVRAQDGIVEFTADEEDAKIMEHVFM
ncbi:clathrin heavy chain linker domain-containing protein 1 [Xenopus laevis]|uniref:Clathrin heavy chain linker domain-containing protein 1 n=2 Tax=Xenopus laevis TaxID=8355 RepID=A0A1L8G5V0_XENLA|nr:clathrin heavy chain linker domain-containing protein 1 [Xenopus laevis]XP_018118006.1 clathrin heavy chain linker domain-containing protein 1 [Xenopus laevis]OCT79278.1 hypothetical protein XELAEV_18026088mg [Xenopus laevis]